MSKAYNNIDDIKRKLREIKKYEIKLRSGNPTYAYKEGVHMDIHNSSVKQKNSTGMKLVWNKFFDLKNSTNKVARYTLDEMSLMTKNELIDIIEEYYYYLYFYYYKEKGIADYSLIDVDILTELGLPFDSDYDDVIRSFKNHVKAYHPDNGGDVSKFIKIMESYERFKAGL